MKKIIFVTLLAILFAASAQAEVVCMKNSKKLPVSAAGKVNVKASQFLATSATTCPTGYTQLVTVAEPVTTYTGIWNLTGAANQNYAPATISFPQALESAPTDIIFVEAGTTNSTCTGTSEAPTAPAGILCIYEAYADDLASDFNNRYFSYDGTTGGSGYAASKYGAAIYGYPETTSDYYAWGSWAVTKP